MVPMVMLYAYQSAMVEGLLTGKLELAGCCDTMGPPGYLHFCRAFV